jgi:hypothetical protein
MLVELDISTVLLLFCGGIIFSIVIGFFIILIFRYLKTRFSTIELAEDPKTLALPSTLETGRSGGLSSRRIFTARSATKGPKKNNIMRKKTKKTLSISGNQDFKLPGATSNAFTVTTTTIGKTSDQNEIRLDTQKLELDITKDEDSKNYKLKLELSNIQDESLTFDDISHLRSPTIGKKVMMEFSKKTGAFDVGDEEDGNIGTDHILAEIEDF